MHQPTRYGDGDATLRKTEIFVDQIMENVDIVTVQNVFNGHRRVNIDVTTAFKAKEGFEKLFGDLDVVAIEDVLNLDRNIGYDIASDVVVVADVVDANWMVISIP